jgi:hypothetical protein
MQRIALKVALTYLRMVCRQHATPELQHLLKHRKRILVPSKVIVGPSKCIHSHACTSSKTNKKQPPQLLHIIQRIAPKAALTYVRMVRRQHATIELQRFFTHRKRIRVPSKRRVRRNNVDHGRACTLTQLQL